MVVTLFLFHWYLLNREKVTGPESNDFVRALSSFSYETRDTSTKFCEMLAKSAKQDCRYSFSAIEKGQCVAVAPSMVIRSMLDYVHSFDMDPTISAMLTMLDAIDSQYNTTCPIGQSLEYWRRMNRIRFSVLSLTHYKLSEELYIKMNARGLPLSPFDCFKADFLGLMDLPEVHKQTSRFVHYDTCADAEETDNDAVTFKQYFATRLDSYWCDLFWSTGDPESYDSAYMLFFSRYFAARYLIEHRDDIQGKAWQKDEYIHFFHKTHEDDKDRYHGIRPFEKMVRDYGVSVGYFEDLKNLLNLFSNRRREILSAMKPIWEDGLVCRDYFCDGSISLEQMPLVTISAVIEFAHCFPEFPMDIFAAWMKCVNCVVENTNIDSYIPAAATAGKLSLLIDLIAAKNPNGVKEFYQAMASVPKNVIGRAAIEEEIEKAKRIIESQEDASVKAWIGVFDTVARHPFLKGMIGFYYDETMTQEVFSDHVELISSLFGADGIAEPYREPHHRLLRAIMSQIVDWSQLNGRYVVESNVQKYLKNLVSSLTDERLRARMHELFAVRLLGKSPALDGTTSKDVLDTLEQIINNAPTLPGLLQWDVREALEVLRSNESFYKWALGQGNPVHVYCNKDQIIARVPKKWSSVMMAVFRSAQTLATGCDMELVENHGGRNGYDITLGMFVGEDCKMTKVLQHFPGVYVCVRFYADYSYPYPVEISLRWDKNLLSRNAEESIRNKFNGEAVLSEGNEHYSRIGTWHFTMGANAAESITPTELRAKVLHILACKQD